MSKDNSKYKNIHGLSDEDVETKMQYWGLDGRLRGFDGRVIPQLPKDKVPSHSPFNPSGNELDKSNEGKEKS